MIKKADVLLLIVLVLLGVLLTVLPFNMIEGKTVRVIVDGEVYEEYPLNEDREIEISQNGHTNYITIKDGYVQMTSSNCLNQICVKKGRTNLTNDPICCLPNRVVIEITDHVIKVGDIDAISE